MNDTGMTCGGYLLRSWILEEFVCVCEKKTLINYIIAAVSTRRQVLTELGDVSPWKGGVGGGSHFLFLNCLLRTRSRFMNSVIRFSFLYEFTRGMSICQVTVVCFRMTSYMFLDLYGPTSQALTFRWHSLGEKHREDLPCHNH